MNPVQFKPHALFSPVQALFKPPSVYLLPQAGAESCLRSPLPLAPLITPAPEGRGRIVPQDPPPPRPPHHTCSHRQGPDRAINALPQVDRSVQLLQLRVDVLGLKVGKWWGVRRQSTCRMGVGPGCSGAGYSPFPPAKLYEIPSVLPARDPLPPPYVPPVHGVPP